MDLKFQSSNLKSQINSLLLQSIAPITAQRRLTAIEALPCETESPPPKSVTYRIELNKH